MIELTLSAQILKEILYNGALFKEALRNALPKESNNHKYSSVVSSLVGCELRHHFLFLELLKKIDVSLDENETSLVLIAFANNYFLKRLIVSDVNECVKVNLKDKYVKSIDDLLLFDGSIIELLKEDNEEKKNSLAFIAMRFNAPLWLLKMWQNQYSSSVTFKLLKKNVRPETTTCRLNTLKIGAEKFLEAASDDFSPAPIKDMFYVKNTAHLRRTNAYRRYEVFTEKLALKKIIDECFKDDYHDAFVYTGDDDSIVRELIVRANNKVNLSVGVPSLDERANLMRLMRVEKIENVKLFEASDPMSMDAACFTKQDIVFAYPKSSSFDRIRQFPDFFIHYDPSKMNDDIAMQKKVLEGAAKHVVDDGCLIYIVDTLNKKEGKGVVFDFIKKHEDFELIEEKQYFPFDEFESAIYVAKFHKKFEGKE